jgi:hypothetical protein
METTPAVFRFGVLSILVRYNLKIIFANKFKYFLIAAVAFFLLIAIPSLFDTEEDVSQKDVFGILMFPGLLLVFYPAAFGIQNDMDTRMIETLFGIPDYRYKVWLVRLLLIYAVVFLLLLALALLSGFALVEIRVFRMVFHLMFPVFFLGSLAFMLSTVVRSGNATAVIMVVLGLGFWIGVGFLEHSRWNIFLNPFNIPQEMGEVVWAEIVLHSRITLVVETALCILLGLFNLQKRERFV